jgi:hypothetical protein
MALDLNTFQQQFIRFEERIQYHSRTSFVAHENGRMICRCQD